MVGDAQAALPAGVTQGASIEGFTEYKLANGLTVLLFPDASKPTTTVNVTYKVGSAYENYGETGMAHLLEHMMFKGTPSIASVFQELGRRGMRFNGTTSFDRTNYFENGPKNALELMLFLESDRAAYLLKSMSPAKVDGQRDVVKNERRQSYENRPYGMSSLMIDSTLYPYGHPYNWPTIGSMDDLTAASYEDVVDFFKKYYLPNNASLVIAGDIDPAATKSLVEKWFREVPRGAAVPPMDRPAAYLTQEKRLLLEDNVQLPRLYMAWHSPALLAPGDAELDVLANILAGGKNSRLYKRLVYDMQIAQDVSAFQASSELASSFQIIVTARNGHTLQEMLSVVQEEINKIKNEKPTQREVQRAINGFEASFLNRLEGLGGKADQLNSYFINTGNPDYFNEDLARYKALSPNDIQSAAQTWLHDDARVLLSIVPKGKPELAVPVAKGGQ